VAGHDGVRYASVGGRVSPRNNPHRSNDVAIETTPVIGRYYTAKDGMGKMRQVKVVGAIPAYTKGRRIKYHVEYVNTGRPGGYYTAQKFRAELTSDDLRAYAKEAGDIKVASRYLIAARELDRMKG
jgi:hypothetical protein